MKNVVRLVAFMALSALTAPSAYADGPSAFEQRPVSATDLTNLYAGKTWRWGTAGAGYFRPDHTFLAWSGTGTDRAIGAGQWKVGSRGRICFSARWYLGGAEHPARSCFLTVETGAKILQRNVEPDKRWYIFKHPEIQTYDEINQLVDGDEVTLQFSPQEMKRIMK